MEKMEPLRCHVESELLNVSIEKQKEKKSHEIELSKDKRNRIIEKKLEKYAKNYESYDSEGHSDYEEVVAVGHESLRPDFSMICRLIFVSLILFLIRSRIVVELDTDSQSIQDASIIIQSPFLVFD